MPAQVNQAGIITILRFITPIHTCEATGDCIYGISILGAYVFAQKRRMMNRRRSVNQYLSWGDLMSVFKTLVLGFISSLAAAAFYNYLKNKPARSQLALR